MQLRGGGRSPACPWAWRQLRCGSASVWSMRWPRGGPLPSAPATNVVHAVGSAVNAAVSKRAATGAAPAPAVQKVQGAGRTESRRTRGRSHGDDGQPHGGGRGKCPAKPIAPAAKPVPSGVAPVARDAVTTVGAVAKPIAPVVNDAAATTGVAANAAAKRLAPVAEDAAATVDAAADGVVEPAVQVVEDVAERRRRRPRGPSDGWCRRFSTRCCPPCWTPPRTRWRGPPEGGVRVGVSLPTRKGKVAAP